VTKKYRTDWVFTDGLALIFALSIPNVLDILIAAYDLWAPTILVPLAAGLLGFRVAPARLCGVDSRRDRSLGLGPLVRQTVGDSRIFDRNAARVGEFSDC
jgi:hypothetical protein